MISAVFVPFLLMVAAPAPAPTTAAAETAKPATITLASTARPWTGDLDGMVKRRVIRVLTPYSRTHYFVDKGVPRGILYEFGKKFEDALNAKRRTGHLRVHVVFIPTSREELLPALIDGRGDIASAALTITPERQKSVDFTIPSRTGVNEIVVTGPRSPSLSSIADLSGQEVFVRKSSSYYESLSTLNERLRGEGKKEVVLKPAPESLEDEDLLEMVNAGLVRIVVVDNYLATFWKQMFPKIVLHEDMAVRTGGELAAAVRKDSPLLKAELGAFMKSHGQGTAFGNVILQRYLRSTRFVKNATADADMRRFEALLETFRKYGSRYGVDPLLMTAQGYQESGLDHNVKSRVGAVGVMQVMPATGQELKVGNVAELEPNIHAGIKYVRFVIDQYYAKEPMTDLDKVLFAFASYNCGPGRVRQLRRQAAAKGLDPNRWFNNVERVAAEKIGRETVQYVSNIYKYYIAYRLIAEEVAEKEKEKAILGQSAVEATATPR